MADEAPWERLIELVETRTLPRRADDHERPKLAWSLAAIVMQVREGSSLPLALDHCRIPRVRGVVWSDLGLHGVPVFHDWIRDVHKAYADFLQDATAVQRNRRRGNAASERMFLKACRDIDDLAKDVPSWMDRDRIRAYTSGMIEACSAQPIVMRGGVTGHAARAPSDRHRRETQNLLARDVRLSDYRGELSVQRKIASAGVDDYGITKLRAVR